VSTALMVLQIVISVVLILSVMLQSGKSAGLSGVISGGQGSFFSKSKDLDSLLNKITTVMSALFLVIALVITAIAK